MVLMEISNLSNKKLRYLSKHYHYPNSFFSQSLQPPFTHSQHHKTLASPKPSIIPIVSSIQFHSNPTSHPPFPFISSNGAFSISSITYPSHLGRFSPSLHLYRFSGYRRFLISSSGLSSFCSIAYPRSQSSHINGYTSPNFKIGLFRFNSRRYFRCVSVSSVNISPLGKVGNYGFRPHATPVQVREIIEMIKGNESDLESRLNLMNVSLSIASMTQIFQVLNSKKVCALRFFHWSRQSQPEFYRNCDICSLIVDNCGRRDDLGAMLCVLNDFRLSKVYLTQKAFGFLPAMVLSKALTEKSLSRVIDVLNKVGGSCAVSGFRALIEMLCVVGCFELAQFVIKKAGRKVSYYNILIRGMCLRCDFEGARKLLDEMRHVGCDPNAQSYNFILGVLSRTDKIAEAREVFEDMLERGYLPNAITFEILIYGMLRHSNLDIACEFLDRMTSFGIEPRLTTHAAFIRNYFAAQKYEEAYNYVVVSGEKYRQASNMMYSMLARLHRNKGNLSLSVNILFEMINKGLKPYFPDYIKALKHLWKSGRIDLARDLEKRFSSLSLQPTTNTA